MRARNVWAEVDLSAIAHNVQVTRKVLKPGTKICAVVKADAYGHGAVPVATAALAAGVNYLAVSMTQEALELREAGIMAPILILGTMTEEHEKALVDYNITQTVYDLAVAQELSAAALQENKVAKVHLAVDTGMNRIGCRPEEAADLAEAISKLPILPAPMKWIKVLLKANIENSWKLTALSRTEASRFPWSTSITALVSRR